MNIRRQGGMAAALLGVMLLSVPVAAGQASSLDSAEAAAFMGTWVLTMESPRGTNEQTVTIGDEGGKVAAQLQGARGGSVNVTDIAKDADALVLSFSRNFQGNDIDIVLSLSLDGDTMHADQDVNDGMFSITGSGTKQ